MVGAVEKREASAPRGGPRVHGAFETGLRRVATSCDKPAGVLVHGAHAGGAHASRWGDILVGGNMRFTSI